MGYKHIRCRDLLANLVCPALKGRIGGHGEEVGLTAVCPPRAQIWLAEAARAAVTENMGLGSRSVGEHRYTVFCLKGPFLTRMIMKVYREERGQGNICYF